MREASVKHVVSTALGVAAAVAASAWPVSAAKAGSAADFYAGKTVSIYVGVAPGGIYSNFAQILARHMEKHMAGKPNFIVQHMEGAGGARSVDYIYNVAPKDGTAVITPNAGAALRVLLRIGNPKYDPAKLHWLGGWGDAVNVVTVLKGAPAASLEEAKAREVVLGAIGKSSNTYMIPALINNILGTKFKIITGYTGGAPIRLAIEKGEVHGWAGQWTGWKQAKPEWVRDGRLVHLVQLGAKRSRELPDVPLLSDFARTDEERVIFRAVQAGIADLAFVAPPGVPPDRLAALGAAYMATLNDPAFRAEAEKQQYDIDPVAGESIQEYVAGMMQIPPATVSRMRSAMGLEE
jgi:tripartite-type tricarboxylate transporter receptor subunit TctC